MIVLRYSRSGHFDGMTKPKLEKVQTVQDKWGFVSLFDSTADAMSEFDRIAAHWREKVATSPELEAILPAPCNPKVFRLMPVEDAD